MMRRVKSFVRREGRITRLQKQALSEFWGQYGLSIDKEKYINFSEIFNNNSPCILEVGFGMGDSLFHQMLDHPEWNYLGVEVYQPGVGALLAAMDGKPYPLRIFREDSWEVLEQAIPDNSLYGIQVFFPDPWPKKRHKKRRLVNHHFIKLMLEKLQNKGFFHMATDCQDYAEQVLAALQEKSELVPALGEQGFISRDQANRPVTKYERRALGLGHDIWDIKYNKR